MLPDLLTNGLKLVICGSAAGQKSAEVGNYYAGPETRCGAVHERGGAGKLGSTVVAGIGETGLNTMLLALAIAAQTPDTAGVHRRPAV